MIRGALTPECNAAVRAVLEALGKKAGQEDDRTEGQRFRDALQLAWEPLPRVGRYPRWHWQADEAACAPCLASSGATAPPAPPAPAQI